MPERGSQPPQAGQPTYQVIMSKHTSSLDASELWSLYAYNPLTGKLFSLIQHKYIDGTPYIDNRNYAGMSISCRFGGKTTTANYSRVVYAWLTGEWSPAGYHIDHINNNSLDNRPWNLRRVTVRENNQNRKGYEYPGTYWNTNRRKWQAQIRIGKRRVYLGLFTDRAAAFATYIAKCDELGYAVLPEVRQRLRELQES